MEKRKLLLSACCGPCSAAALERLNKEYKITIFFYGNNLDSEEEYTKRLNALKTVNERLNDNNTMIIAPYMHKDMGFAEEPEGGKRCVICFYDRLTATADVATAAGFDLFATTLTTSPRKNAELINNLGEEIAKDFGLRYLPTDFKKDNGFLRSVQLSKELGIYRQKYCGCRP
jgi:predicted adenine nucleotide alpha hydrolase (AANH) superfamily ATPase